MAQNQQKFVVYVQLYDWYKQVIAHLFNNGTKNNVMKTLLSFLFLISFFQLSAQQNDQETVKQTILEMFQQFSDRNAEKLKLYCTEDIQILESGEIWNLDTLTKKINQNKALDFKRVNKINFLNVTVENNTAWTTYDNQADVTKNGEHYIVKWLETAILKKRNGTWKIKVLHSSLLKREKL
jgi:ketosteroid isomerase-like protein